MKSADILAKLMGSAGRVKIIRLFLLNHGEIFPFSEICQRAKVSKKSCHREISLLRKIGFIKPQTLSLLKPKVKIKKKKAVKENKRKKIQRWKLNDFFPLLSGLKNFILNTAPISRDQLLKKLQKTGRVKLVILAGIFGGEDSGRVDILVVGDKILKSGLEKIIRDIEAEVGKELTYAAFSTEEFLYRLGMYDKFIRDILDYPHEKILDKIGI